MRSPIAWTGRPAVVRKFYPEHEKIAAIALAEAAGAPAASQELMIPAETIRAWVADAKPSTALQRARDAALAMLTFRLTTGQMRDRDASVFMGIAADKSARYDKPLVPEDEPDVDPRHPWEAATDAYIATVPADDRPWLRDELERQASDLVRAELSRRTEAKARADTADGDRADVSLLNPYQARPWSDAPEDLDPVWEVPVSDSADDAALGTSIDLFITWFDAQRPALRAHREAREAKRREIGWNLDDEAVDLLLEAEERLAALENIA